MSKKDDKGAGQTIVVDYQKAIQNLTDILIDIDKFREMCKNIYDAIDTDNEGTLKVGQVETFVRDFLKGNQIEGQTNTAFETDNDQIFKLLQENESGEVNLDELSKFLNELLKNQVKALQRRLETQKYERSLAMQKELEEAGLGGGGHDETAK